MAKIAMVTAMLVGAIAKKTPTAVATPLPPRNFSHTLKTCPRTAKTAAQAIRVEYFTAAS